MEPRNLRLNELATDVYPAAWYAVAPSRSLRRGGLLEADVCGRKLVVFRTRSGALSAMDRFCPHMGASLACGRVAAEEIVCPFHAWTFSTSGACTGIPYLEDGERIPPTAKVSTVPVVEHLGWLWVHHGDTPSYALPDMPEMHDAGWGVVHKSQRFETHALHILENATDLQHFRTIHKVDFVDCHVDEIADEPHRWAFRIRQTLNNGARVGTTIDYAGASAIFGTLEFNERKIARFIAAPLPQGAKKTLFHLIVATPRLPLVARAFDGVVRHFIAKKIFEGSTDDYFPVWRDLDPSHRRVLVGADKMQQRFRKYWAAHIPELTNPLLRRAPAETSDGAAA